MNHLNTYKNLFLVLIISTLTIHPVFAQKDIMAKTPPMGWNSWNKFARAINEDLIKDIADAMVNSGMKDAGYEYVVIDDLWQKGRVSGDSVIIEGRDKNQMLIPDPEKFPGGMKLLGDYIHSKGLKFGLYTGPGKSTCGGAPGSLGFEEIDIATFDSWGVDFIKLDKCSFSGDIESMLKKWRGLLDQASHPITLSVNMGVTNFQTLSTYVNMWRTTSDIQTYWSYPKNEPKLFPSITDVIRQHGMMSVPQSPSSWNDPDMMQVGNGQLTDEENKSHFNMWAIFGAPLIAGNDLRNMSPEVVSILTNCEVIEVNQDPLGFRGIKVVDDGQGLQVWAKKLYKYSDYAVLLFNLKDMESTITFQKEYLGIKGPFFVRDLGAHTDLGSFSNSLKISIPPHGSFLLKITANEEPLTIMPIAGGNVFKNNLTLEAEDAACYESGFIDDKALGYSGNGFFRGSKMADWARFGITWKVTTENKTDCFAEIKYMNPNSREAHCSLNNQDVKMPVAKSGEWKIVTVPFSLEQGDNIITLRSKNSTDNLVAIDYIHLFKKNKKGLGIGYFNFVK